VDEKDKAMSLAVAGFLLKLAGIFLSDSDWYNNLLLLSFRKKYLLVLVNRQTWS